MTTCRFSARLKSIMVFAVVVVLARVVPAHAAPPTVVTSIKPVQALVKMVMGNVGDPDVVIPATTSPHLFTLKPSQARMLENAQIIFWIGAELETTLKGPLQKLTGQTAGQTQPVSLLQVPQLRLIQFPTGGLDPHIWLSPGNARLMVTEIAQVLSTADPDNATIYASNAKKARQRIAILVRKITAFTQTWQDTPYLVQHDGFGYLKQDFGFNEVGFIQTIPGREPGARHVAEILDLIRTKGVKCLLHEPQFAPKLAQRLNNETGVQLREIDLMGTDLSLSETTYVRIIQNIVTAMNSCLKPSKTPLPTEPKP